MAKVKIVASRDININIGHLKQKLEKDKETEVELTDREVEVILVKLGKKEPICTEIKIGGKTLKGILEEQEKANESKSEEEAKPEPKKKADKKN
ncbi:hypothetical protein PM10SUCC1_32410 [Propionigenium maris DSM 9537]|uniref:Uncharacterized protein n=1 Tax=Propionigenium maris DSM 9537 TaxID=1123000 RepID=A0A9W6GNN2_9FUSO|nr:hypothetical protein [Propionigenium maris]GLI57727.1 hypothetical protein PM10SUCC1_32410 [Propionigenium maris DSM 9537]